MTVTRFNGTSLPDGWTAVEPAGGHVTVGNGYAALQSDAGVEFDSISGGTPLPEGPRISVAVAGAFDYAVALANAVNVSTSAGVDVLALDVANSHGIRFAQYVSGINNREASWFAYRNTPTADAAVSITSPPSNLYGPRSWMRLSWDGASTWTLRASHTGKPGTWHQLAQFTDSFAPTTFDLALTAFGPDANGREMRINRVVDMAGRADDATVDPGDVSRVTFLEADLSGTSLPPGFASQVNAGGTVTVADGHVTLTTDANTLDSYAWLLGPTNLPADHGMLLKYRFPQPNVVNCFAAPIIRGADATDLPASQVLKGKYRPGTGLLAEINGGDSGSGDIFRLLTAHPVAEGSNFDGSLEFYGFSMIVEDTTSPVNGADGVWIWLRLEAVGGYFRARVWYDGAAEPTTWQYEGEDHTQTGTGSAIAWSHNDGITGGTAAFDVGHYELYSVELPVEGVEASLPVGLSLGGTLITPPEPPGLDAPLSVAISLRGEVAQPDSLVRHTTPELVEETLEELSGYTETVGQATWLTEDLPADALKFKIADESMVKRGIVEIGNELIRVASSSNGECTVFPSGRGYRASRAGEWPAGTEVNFSPRFPKHAVLNTINDVLTNTYPLLWGVGVVEFPYTPVELAFPLPAEAEGVLTVDWDPVGPQDSWFPIATYKFDPKASRRDFPTGKSIWLPELTPGRTVRVAYRKRPRRITWNGSWADSGLDDVAWPAVKYGALHRLAATLTLGRLGESTARSAEYAQMSGLVSVEVAERYYALHVQYLEEARSRLLDANPIRVNYTR